MAKKKKKTAKKVKTPAAPQDVIRSDEEYAEMMAAAKKKETGKKAKTDVRKSDSNRFTEAWMDPENTDLRLLTTLDGHPRQGLDDFDRKQAEKRIAEAKNG